MKRLALLVVALAVLAPATANAAVPCRDRIYNDWYGDGKIATTYPISCYRDALAHVRTDAAIYSSLKDDIRAAMQGALARLHHHASVPAEIGKGGKSGVKAKVVQIKNHSARHVRPVAHPATTTATITPSATSTISSSPTASTGGGGVPTPILVLGALALLLAAIGAVGTAARRTRRR